MEQKQVIFKIVSEAGRLLHASETRFAGGSGFITAVALIFERFTLYVAALSDDDSISVGLEPLPSDDDCVTDISTQQSPWHRVSSFECQWAWLLTNQQGYTDGVRFEFRTDTGCRVIELLVAASQIHYYEFSHDALPPKE